MGGESGAALTDVQRDMLEFERLRWKYAGAKETAIRERFDMTATRYYQVVNALIEQPAALAYDAPTVRRLMRVRASAARRRSIG